MRNKASKVEPDYEQPESQTEVFRLDIVGNRSNEIILIR